MVHRRVVLALLGSALAVVSWADPVAADPARPTNYRSEVIAVEGDLPEGATVQVVGGDAFLELAVPSGHTAEVPDTAQGPDGEPLPYLRYRADGTVERNASSFSTLANETRYGTAGEAFDPAAPVRWEPVASSGRFVWHDHRIHWMSPDPPPSLGPDGLVDLGGPDGTWEVPITVDGEAVVVRGELHLLDAPSPAPWIALTALVVVGAVGLGLHTTRTKRSVPYPAVAGAGAVVAAAATAVGWAQWQAIPPAAGGNPLSFAVPLVGLLCGVLAAAGPARFRLPALGAAAACLLGWGVLRWSVLSHAILPTSAPFAVDRAATAAGVGVGLALALLMVWHPPRRARPATASPTA